MITKIKNGIVVLENSCERNLCIYYRDGEILEVTPKSLPCDCEIDAKGDFVAPGFIDIHTHGGGNFDFMDGTDEAFLIPAKAHCEHGTTAMYPTVLSGSFEEISAACETFRRVQAQKSADDGARLLGLHLEGPYFAMTQCGAQNKKYIRNPVPEEYTELVRKYGDCIKRWSAAPELPGGEAFAQYLKQNGILASLGHTEIDCVGAYKAFEQGFTHITHLYSCTTGIFRKNARRYAGLNEAAYLHDGITFEIIADGVHLPAELLQFVKKFKSADSVALVTDSMRAAAYREGKSILGSLKDGQEVIVEDGVAKLPDRSAFAGSTATMDRLVRNMIFMGGASMENAVKMASSTPARIMGLERMGQIKKGYTADFVIFDKNITVKRTVIKGKTVFLKDETTDGTMEI